MKSVGRSVLYVTLLLMVGGLVAGCTGSPSADGPRYVIVAEDFSGTTVTTETRITTVADVPEPVQESIDGTQNSTRLRNKSGVAVTREQFRSALGAFYDGPVPDTLASEYEYFLRHDGTRYRITFMVQKE